MIMAKLFHKELKLDHECVFSEGCVSGSRSVMEFPLNMLCRERQSVRHEAAAKYNEFSKLIHGSETWAMTGEDMHRLKRSVIH